MGFKKICFFSIVFFVISCSSHVGIIGDLKYPSLEQALINVAQRIKESFPEKTSLFVYVSEKNKKDSDIAEGTAIKIVEIGAPKISVLERKDMDKALQELENQASDLFDQDTTVPLGKMVGAEFMVVPETIQEKNVFAKLYNTEMDKDIFYQKMDLKIKVIELSSGKIVWAANNIYWEISPAQNLNIPYQQQRFQIAGISRYVFYNPKIMIVPNQPIFIRYIYRKEPQKQNSQTQSKPLIGFHEQEKKAKEEEKQRLKEERQREKLEKKRQQEEKRELNKKKKESKKKKKKKEKEQ